MRSSVILVTAVILLVVSALCALAAQELNIFADQTLRPALQEIAPLFTDKTGFEVQLSLGRSSILAERIRNGVAADLFFPASDEAMRQMMEKGLIDVALKRHILDLPST